MLIHGQVIPKVQHRVSIVICQVVLRVSRRYLPALRQYVAVLKAFENGGTSCTNHQDKIFQFFLRELFIFNFDLHDVGF